MASKDTTIFYQNQIEICKKHFTTEQFGRLMLALFEVEDGRDPEVDDDIAIAFEFMALQKKIDREKYEKKCQKNRENGKKGGAPKGNQNARKNNPKQPNGFQNNPNEDDDVDDDVDVDDDDNSQHSVSLGTFKNVELTEEEHGLLKSTYERSNELINKVSVWIHGAKGVVPDHYGLCVKFAEKDEWPKRRIIEPASLPEVLDPIDPEEQERLVAHMTEVLSHVGDIPSN